MVMMLLDDIVKAGFKVSFAEAHRSGSCAVIMYESRGYIKANIVARNRGSVKRSSEGSVDDRGVDDLGGDDYWGDDCGAADGRMMLLDVGVQVAQAFSKQNEQGNDEQGHGYINESHFLL